MSIQSKPSQESNPATQDIDFTLRDIIKLAWKRKWSWILIHFVVIALTVSYVLFWATPFYTSSVVVVPKENSGSGSDDLLSKLGGLGSMVGAGLDINGSTNLDKTALILNSGDFLTLFIEKYDLLPELFYKNWDSLSGNWLIEKPEKYPTTLKGIKKMQDDVLVIAKDATVGALTITMTIQGEGQSKLWVDRFLHESNLYLKRIQMQNINKNKSFLKNRMNRTSNPKILEKIQNLLAFEVEKEMLADDESFEIIESSVIPLKPSWPNKPVLLILAILVSNFIWALYAISFPVWIFIKHLLSDEQSA